MKLPEALTKKLSKVLVPEKKSDSAPKTTNGVVVKHGDNVFVILDGSTIETPVELAVDAEDGDRVAVQIKDHKATVVSNYSAPPSARTATTFMQLTEDGLVVSPDPESTSMQLLLAPSSMSFRYHDTSRWVDALKISPSSIDRGTDGYIFGAPGLPDDAFEPSSGYENVDCVVHAWRADKLIQMLVEITSNTSVASGSNIYEGDLTAGFLTPALYVTGVGYYDGHAIIGRITPAGKIVVRNASSSAVTVSDTVNLSFTYILDLTEA